MLFTSSYAQNITTYTVQHEAVPSSLWMFNHDLHVHTVPDCGSDLRYGRLEEDFNMKLDLYNKSGFGQS